MPATQRLLFARGLARIAALIAATFANPLHAASAPVTRVSLAELRADLAAGGSPLVLFTSDDPACGFCVPANDGVPARVGRQNPDAELWMVSWSPWRSFPAELGDVPLTGRLEGIPAIVRFSNGRESWRVTGYSEALLAQLDQRLRTEASASEPRTIQAAPSPDPAARAPAAPVATLGLVPATHRMFWGNQFRPDVAAKDAAGRSTGVDNPQWSSSDPGVASVTSDGVVTSHRRGTAVITLNVGAHSATTTVNVVGFRQLARTSAALPCAIADDRVSAYCWGTSRILPTARHSRRTDAPSELMRGDIPSGATLAALVTEAQHACLLTGEGSLHCWGQQKDGAAGLGDLTPRDVPTRIAQGEVPPASRFTAVAVGPHGTCAIVEQRAMYCWGARGALPLRAGFATNDRLLAPVATERGELPSGARLTAVSVSINGGCVIADGHPYCWKRGTRIAGPMRLDAGDLPAGITLEELQSDDFACGRGRDGRAYCWGSGRGQRFGAGDEAFRQQGAPTAVGRGAIPQGVALTRVTLGSIAGANCGAGTDGEAYCWGNGANGAAGDGDPAAHVVPQAVRVLPGERPASVKFVDINCGNQFCTALGDDGVLYGWGSNLGETLGRDSQVLRFASAPVRANGPIR